MEKQNDEMFQETICAVSTPNGMGGIAVIRVSGPDAMTITDRIWKGKSVIEMDSHTAHLGYITDETGQAVDQAVITVFKAPKSFTGENVVEISVHGSKWIQREVLRLLVINGCRMAQAGEFSRRAFANGRMDLAEIEGVADLIASSSRASNRLAMSQMKGEFSNRLKQLHDRLLNMASLLELELDFSEEEVEFASRKELNDMAHTILSVVNNLARSFIKGNAIKEGVPVAIVGNTNAGKSTLLNALLQEDRAIVSDIHGTTRDVIEDTVEIDDVAFRFIDTAGLRDTSDTIEEIGINRAIDRMQKSRIVLWVIDSTGTVENLKEAADKVIGHKTADEWNDKELILVANKCDAADPDALLDTAGKLLSESGIESFRTVRISARDGVGIDNLQNTLLDASGINEMTESDVVVTNLRHYEALTLASQSIERVISGLGSSLPSDLVAQDVRETLLHLGEITGTITSQDILNNIFAHFCIGK